MGPLLYLDACAIQRGMDALTTPRLRLEAEAIEMILERVARDEAELAWSPALEYECVLRAPFARARYAQGVRSLARRWVPSGPAVIRQTEHLKRTARLRPLDAFHVALASSVSAAFVTTDKRLLRRLRRVEPPPLRGLDPLEAVVELFGE